MNNKRLAVLSTVLIVFFMLLFTPAMVFAEEENNVTDDTNTSEEHKVAVITTKVDEEGNPLSGATLQILDSNGNVMDEWVTDGTEHETLLPEGDYVLHETAAPEGYMVAEDKPFTVKVEVVDLNAGVDFSETPCEHYEGTPLYYVEIKGRKYEVYCINQDWETPDENSIYDGAVLNPSDIGDYTTQTVYADAHKNTAAVDVSDQTLSKQELYDKLLDIIYHRQKASNIFTDLTEAEIRYVTEAALKNYTNAGLTRVQGMLITKAPENYDLYDYYINGSYVYFLYPWYRGYVYVPDAPLGSNIYRWDIGNGDAFGNLARHWNDAHGAKNSAEVRAKIARFYELYLYLISDTDHHPSDMHLYIYSSNSLSPKISGDDNDGGRYQNLLGITWYDQYDEDHVINLELMNKKEPEKKEKKKQSKKTQKKEYKNPKTGDSIAEYIIMLSISTTALAGSAVASSRKEA